MAHKTKPLNELVYEIAFEDIAPLQQGYICLYHYTSKEAQSHIVEDQALTFRFSRADQFQDKNEGIHILEPYRHVCGKLYNQDQIDSDFYALIKDIKISAVENMDNIPWILCLTANGCSRYMKERYAPGDGHIIGMQATFLDDLYNIIALEKGCQKNCDIFYCEVIYSRENIETKLEALLLRLYESYQTDVDTIKSKNSVLKEAIGKQLFAFSYCYKSAEFQDEQEIRLIVYPKKGVSVWDNGDFLRLYMNPQDEKLYLNMGKQYFYCDINKLEQSNLRNLNKGILTGKEIRQAYIDKH